MKLTEAEKLLGGYATGTLTAEERKALFAAALEQQDIFDALMDEEALRELLGDPSAKARLLAALAPMEGPQVVPFWRRTGVLGVAASLMVASLAGLAYLRSPKPGPPPVEQETAKAMPTQAPIAVPSATTKESTAPKNEVAAPAQRPARQSEVAGTPPGHGAAAAAHLPPPPASPQGVAERLVAQAPVPAEAPLARAKVMDAPKRPFETQDRLTGAVGAAPGGVVSGVVGGGAVSRPEPAITEAQVAKQSDAAPQWRVVPGPNGSIQVTVLASPKAQVLLLKRGRAGVEVLRLQMQAGARGDLVSWRTQVHLAPGDALDLYLLNYPVADPSKLPETGPVDGFRVRIHPAK